MKNTAKNFELPCLDQRKSFYGKARVIVSDDGARTLPSYNTAVCKLTQTAILCACGVGTALQPCGTLIPSCAFMARMEAVKRGGTRRKSVEHCLHCAALGRGFWQIRARARQSAGKQCARMCARERHKRL